MNFAISNAIGLSTHFWILKEIKYKELNESSVVRSACWQLYKNRKESKIMIREYFFALNSRYALTLHVASSCKDEHIRSLKHPYYIRLLNN